MLSRTSSHICGRWYLPTFLLCYKCGRVDCDEEYIGETSRTFAERFKEHQKAPSPIFDHHTITGHDISVEHFNIVGREENNVKRAIKEALYIRVNNPSLNRNVGKYHQYSSNTRSNYRHIASHA